MMAVVLKLRSFIISVKFIFHLKIKKVIKLANLDLKEIKNH